MKSAAHGDRFDSRLSTGSDFGGIYSTDRPRRVTQALFAETLGSLSEQLR